jgi:hypothetical protein
LDSFLNDNKWSAESSWATSVTFSMSGVLFSKWCSGIFHWEHSRDHLRC